MTDPITYTGETYTQPVSEKNLFEQVWLTPSKEDLAPGTALREVVTEQLESWHPNHVTDSGRITGYDDWIERLEGLDVPGTDGVKLDLGSDPTEAPWTILKSIAKALARELA